jgi:hypothetical protein
MDLYVRICSGVKGDATCSPLVGRVVHSKGRTQVSCVVVLVDMDLD